MERIIREMLHLEITRLGTNQDSAIARRATQRLRDVADHFPAYQLMLAEPWLAQNDSHAVADTLSHCARVHLYARILDDALDENLPVHRLNLLRAQPMYWRTISALGACYPQLHRESEALIAQTVQAVSQDDLNPEPVWWSAKNHHLLLAPLLLSGNSPEYQQARPGLSAVIALTQASDEWSQNVVASPAMARAVLEHFPLWLAEDSVQALQRHGWHGAAERLLKEGRSLLEKFNPETLHVPYSPPAGRSNT